MSGDCAGPGLAACLEDGRARSATKWTWRNGQTLELSIGRATASTPGIALWLLYRDGTPRGTGQPKLDAL